MDAESHIRDARIERQSACHRRVIEVRLRRAAGSRVADTDGLLARLVDGHAKHEQAVLWHRQRW